MDSKDLGNYYSNSVGTIGDQFNINWEEKYRDLKSQYDVLKRERDELECELRQCQSQEKSALPSKDELESISSMLDIIKKLDEGTIDKIERLKERK